MTTSITAAMRALPAVRASSWEHPGDLDLVLLNVCTTERPGGGAATSGMARLVGGAPPAPTWAWYGRGAPARRARDLLGEIPDAIPILPLDGSTGSFLQEVVFPLCYKAPRAALGAWDDPAFLCQIAQNITTVRDRFNLTLWTYRDAEGQVLPNDYRPQVKIDRTPARISYGSRRDADPVDYVRHGGRRLPYPGRFLSVSSPATALSGEPNLTFPSALELWGVDRRPGLIGELDALEELCLRLIHDLKKVWGVEVPPDRISSAGGIPTDYARRGVSRPPSHRRGPSRRAQAACLAAGLGGRAEARLRLVDVPVVLPDGIANYQVPGHLLGVSSYLQAERVSSRHLSERHGLEGLTKFLENLTPEQLLDPATWPRIAGVAMVEPNGSRGVVRGSADEGEDATITTIIESGTHTVPMMLPDVADAVLAGHMPKMISADLFSAEGVVPEARRVNLPGEIAWDPRLEVARRGRTYRDLPTALAEVALRAKAGGTLGDVSPFSPEAFLQAAKVARNACGYGLPGNLNPSPRRAHRAWGPFGPLDASLHEELGWLFDSLVYALVASGARLLLGLLERLLRDAGGDFVFADTDALPIVATPSGGEIPVAGAGADGSPILQTVHALSYSEVVESLNRFGPLAASTGLSIPAYQLVPEGDGFRLVPCQRGKADLFSIFKITSENLDASGVWSPGTRVLAVEKKRYALFREGKDGKVTSAKASGHVLATLENFRADGLADWDRVGAVWERKIARHTSGQARPLPDDLDLEGPVVQALAPSTPRDFKALGTLAFSKDNPHGFRPFESLIVPIPVQKGLPQLVAPWTADRASWKTLIFNDPSGNPWRLVTLADLDARGFPSSLDGRRHAVVYDLGSWLERYFTRPEPGALGPDGKPCTELTRGLLTRQPVRITGIRYVGAEPVRRAATESVVGWDVHVDQVEVAHGCMAPGCRRRLPPRARRWCKEHARYAGRERARLLRQRNERTCQECGVIFPARSRADKRFCSNAHKLRARRAKRLAS